MRDSPARAAAGCVDSGSSFTLVVLAFCGLLLAGCEREPGPRPGEVLFWRISSSEISFGDQCSDEKEFRQVMGPIPFEANTYLIYRVDQQATKAASLRCTSFDSDTCAEPEDGVVFDVAGTELLLSRDLRSPIGSGGCELQQAQSWTLRDLGEKLAMSIVSVLSLVGTPSACDKVEQRVVSESPNQHGFQGCMVTFSVGADRR